MFCHDLVYCIKKNLAALPYMQHCFSTFFDADRSTAFVKICSSARMSRLWRNSSGCSPRPRPRAQPLTGETMIRYCMHALRPVATCAFFRKKRTALAAQYHWAVRPEWDEISTFRKTIVTVATFYRLHRYFIWFYGGMSNDQMTNDQMMNDRMLNDWMSNFQINLECRMTEIQTKIEPNLT
jgi:hypothetical protein